MNREEVKKILLECGFKYSALMEVAAQQIIDRLSSQSSESGEGWISVSETPAYDELMWVTDGKNVSKARYLYDGFAKIKNWMFGTDDTMIINVTHYMTIIPPQPPTLTDH